MKIKIALILSLLIILSSIGIAQQKSPQLLYHDEELGFEVRYPDDWKVERWDNGKSGIVVDFTGPLHKEKFGNKILEVHDSFSIDVFDPNDNKIKTIKQYAREYYISPNDKAAKNYRFENFNLNGYKGLAIRYRDRDQRFPVGDGHKVVMEGSGMVLVIRNNKIYSFPYPVYPVEKQILRTFRFTK